MDLLIGKGESGWRVQCRSEEEPSFGQQGGGKSPPFPFIGPHIKKQEEESGWVSIWTLLMSVITYKLEGEGG